MRRRAYIWRKSICLAVERTTRSPCSFRRFRAAIRKCTGGSPTSWPSKANDAAAQMQAARSGFESVLERHPLAFADHGAEFYAGSGNDCRRALELALVNVANRPTLRAFEQAHEIAVSAGDDSAAAPLLGKATERWGDTAGFKSSPLAACRLARPGRSSRMTIDRRTFVAGTTLVAFAPAVEFLPAPLSPPAANASRLVFMIDGWSVPE